MLDFDSDDGFPYWTSTFYLHFPFLIISVLTQLGLTVVWLSHIIICSDFTGALSYVK